MTGRGEDGVTFGLDEIAVENVDGRQPEKPFTEMWDRLMDPAVPQDVKTDLALDAMTTMFAAWRVGTIRVDGISVEAPKENASFSLEQLLDDRLVECRARQPSSRRSSQGSGPDGFLSLGSLELAGFVAPDLKALVQFAALEKNSDLAKHAAAIKQTFAALPRLAHFGLHDVSAGKSEADSGSLANFTMDFADWNDDLGRRDRHPPRRSQHPAPAARARSADDGDFRYARLRRPDARHVALGPLGPGRRHRRRDVDFSLKDAADLELSYSLTGLTHRLADAGDGRGRRKRGQRRGA